MKSSLTYLYARFSIQYSEVKHLWVKNIKRHSNSTSALYVVFLRSPWFHSNLTSVLYVIFHGLIKCSVAKKKKKGSVRGVQTFCWRGVFQPKSSLPVEVHGRLLAVLCTVASGPTVVTGQIPTLFVTGAIAAAHQALGLVHPRCPRHEVLHGWHCKRGLPT